ncbi:hypothetical protein HY546_01695, partial [archaeon]|nr:hypothetical protein [archaeon]
MQKTFLRSFALLSTFLLVASSFSPAAFAEHDPTTPAKRYEPKEENIDLGDFSAAKCDGGAVWVTDLSPDQYLNLLSQSEYIAKSELGKIAAFGNQQVQGEQDALNKANIYEDPSVGRMNDKFLLNTKYQPVILADVLKNRRVDPYENNCHLNRLVTTGFVQYAARTDQNIRFCGQLGDTDCEGGATQNSKLGALQGEMNELTKLLNYVKDTSADTIHANFEKQVKEPLVKLGFNTAENTVALNSAQTDLKGGGSDAERKRPLAVLVSDFAQKKKQHFQA